MRCCWLLPAAVFLTACSEDPLRPPQPFYGLAAELVAEGLTNPLMIGGARGDRGRLFIAEQNGRIWMIRNGEMQTEPFLDISDIVSEVDLQGRGLIGFAFHPLDGRLFVSYTTGPHDALTSWVVAYRRLGPDRVDPASATVVLQVSQPQGDHNGGHILFGPDRRLYVSLGDGGSGAVGQGAAQRLDNVFGSILRLDVDDGAPFAIPNDNPFVGNVTARPEVWSYGLRHPWRISFDRRTGDLYIADVGEAVWEELNVQPAGSTGGVNWGWPIMEGSACLQSETCDATPFHLPVYEYSHAEGCSITGGHVYRGRLIPEIDGLYFFSDFCAGWIRSLRWSGESVSDVRDWTSQLNAELESVITFGEDGAGELYFGTLDGNVYRIVADREESEEM